MVWSLEDAMSQPETVVLTTSIVTFISGFLLGIYSIRGYLISPDLADERRHNLTDPLESDESDIDDDDILDHAPNWANGEDADRRDGLRVAQAKAAQKSLTAAVPKDSKSTFANTEPSTYSKEECKLVLVVRSDLGMTKGKIAAQCGHATLACYKSISRAAADDAASPAARQLRNWERGGQAKIAVQAKGQDALLELMGTARSLGITAEVIADAGRTQIDPGSLTVLGVGPAPKSLIDKVTGGLKLL